jgi:hypothetical protein
MTMIKSRSFGKLAAVSNRCKVPVGPLNSRWIRPNTRSLRLPWSKWTRASYERHPLHVVIKGATDPLGVGEKRIIGGSLFKQPLLDPAKHHHRIVPAGLPQVTVEPPAQSWCRDSKPSSG